MPKAAKKKATTAPVKPLVSTPPPAATTPTVAVSNPDNLPVIYDRLEVDEYSTATEKGPLDPEWCKTVLGWETEKEFQARMVTEKPGSKPENWIFGDTFHCMDAYGNKVYCHNNAHNRPFDIEWSRALIQSILNGQWAGPFTVPGETVNGETVRISRYGRVLSGQHQMTACILASQVLEKDREAKRDHPDDPKYPVWRTQGYPFIETIVVKGCSEDPRVLMTVDYVKPRTAADVFYTSDIFKQSRPGERLELCKMLASAVDMLWARTQARGYKTHPEIVGFLERHKRLMKCVEHVFGENKPSKDGGRAISRLRLNPGQCAAICYLMGCSVPDIDAYEIYGDEYRNMEPAPSEKGLNWDNWERALEFWTGLAQSREFQPVRTALGRLFDSAAGNEENMGLGGRGPEKLAILAKAWEIYKVYTPGTGAPFSDADLGPEGGLCLSYSDLDDKGNRLPNGEIKLLDVADFLGIDCPTTVARDAQRGGPPEPPPPTGEEYERMKAEARQRHAGQK